MKGQAWTQEEEEFFLQNENELSDADMAELLGRTEKAIWMHRNKLRKKGKYDGYKTKIREEKKMNVAYDQINSSDAAKRIGVSIACIQRWCRDNIINYINVSDGTDKARYLLEEDEVSYLQDLVKKFGTRKAMLWYRKDKRSRQPKPRTTDSIKEHMKVFDAIGEMSSKSEEKPIDISDASMLNTNNRLQQVMPNVEPPKTEVKFVEPKTEVKFVEPKSERETLINKVTLNIMYIQDIKERLEDIEAERQQLLAELKECQDEVMSYIGV